MCVVLLAVGEGWRDGFFPLSWGTVLQLREAGGQGKAQKTPDAELPAFPIRGHGILHTIQTALKHVSI